MKMKRNESARKVGYTKKDHIQYWSDTANRDWIAIKKMLECKSYIYALFFMHLALEKLLKAHWVKDNPGNHPPKTHDLVKLSKQTKLGMVEKDFDFLEVVNTFQLEGRYPDHTQKLFRIYKKSRSFNIFESVNSLRKCLLKKLQ